MKKLIVILIAYHLSLITLSAQYLLYGTTSGYYDASHHLHYGSIYCYNPATNKQTVLFNFNDTDGSGPIGRLLYASDSLLYGFTGGGGSFGKGTVFSFNPKNNVETVVINLNGSNGGFFSSGLNELMQAKDSLLFGTTFAGGASNAGVLFSYNIKTHKDSIRVVFNDSTSNPRGPYMELWQDTSSGILYGVTQRGGFPGGGGVIYGFNPKNNQLKRYFVGTLSSTSPWDFCSGFTKLNDSLLYGMSQAGGVPDSGTIYTFNILTHTVKEVFQFSQAVGGAFPNADELIKLSNGLLYGTANNGAGYQGGILFSFNPVNNTEKTLVTFTVSNGSNPEGRLVQDPDNGLLYGVTLYGGDSNYGVLFSYDTINSIYTKLLDFKGSNGRGPQAGLTLVKDTGKKIDTGIGVVEQKAKREEVRVFPNPSNTLLNIELSIQQEQTATICLYNNIGQLVRCETISNGLSTISSIELASGIYYYRITLQNGTAIKADKQLIMH